LILTAYSGTQNFRHNDKSSSTMTGNASWLTRIDCPLSVGMLPYLKYGASDLSGSNSVFHE